jgi:glycosyltransferase involved in cell wall biosynthesis
LYIEPNNADALAAVLDLLIRDPEAVRDYGNRAQARAAAFSAERMVAQYWRIYQDLTSK